MVRRARPEVEVAIEQFSKKGHGIGRFQRGDGEQCLVEVPSTCPGDRARVQLLRRRSGVYKSFFKELVEASPNRIEPRCRHFASCGGCRWQQISYAQQLKEKEGRVKRLLAPLADSQTQWHQLIPCDPPWNYRNKMEFSFSQNLEGKHFLGLNMLAGKGRVVNLEECHICNPWMMKALQTVRGWWDATDLQAYYAPRDLGSLRTLTLREGFASGDRMVVLLVSGNADYALKQTQINEFVRSCQEALQPEGEGRLSIFLRIQQLCKGKPTQFFEMHLGGPDHIRESLEIEADGKKVTLEFQISPSAFFQPCSLQAAKLYGRALDLAGMPKVGQVYDLYCGTGTLGLFASHYAESVLGVELSPESALDARMNAKRHGRENMEVITGDVGKVLAERRKNPDFVPPGLVMVDPPRSGLDPQALRHISDLAPEKILYISCNPASQAENVAELKLAGYVIEHIQPVDQFPQTVHIENIVILRRPV